MITAVLLLQRTLASVTITRANLMLIGGLTISISLAVMIKLVIALNQRRRLSLAYEAEVVVGKELDRLASHGYRVIHDVLADASTIDHIVVGSKGVFVVHTAVRRNPTSAPKNGLAKPAEYNGHVLFYPDGKDLKTMEKAADQASWLSDWLGQKLGEPIAIRSIVALPGWTVKRTSANGIPVVNPKQFESLFEHIQPRYLSEDTICRIIEQFGQRCRADRLRANVTAGSNASGTRQYTDRRPTRRPGDLPSDFTP